MNSIFEEECPTVLHTVQKEILDAYKTDIFPVGAFLLMVFGKVFEERGREGLRELEKGYLESNGKVPDHLQAINGAKVSEE